MDKSDKEQRLIITYGFKGVHKTKSVSLNDFVFASQKMLAEFGLKAGTKHIRDQIMRIKNKESLDVIGTFLKDYIVK